MKFYLEAFFWPLPLREGSEVGQLGPGGAMMTAASRKSGEQTQESGSRNHFKGRPHAKLGEKPSMSTRKPDMFFFQAFPSSEKEGIPEGGWEGSWFLAYWGCSDTYHEYNNW